MRKRNFRFQSYGIPETLTCLNQWVGWHDGFAVPFALGGHGYYGRALPTDPTSWTDFRTAIRRRFEWRLDGLAFVVTDHDPFFFITLVGAVQHDRLSDSAKLVIRECCTYAEIAPNERDVTLVISFEDEVAAVIGGCALPPEFLPNDFPMHLYDGKVTHWPAPFDIPLSGMFIADHNRIRLLPQPSAHSKEVHNEN